MFTYALPTILPNKSQRRCNDMDSIEPEHRQMVTAAMKLKDACSLEEKLWPT